MGGGLAACAAVANYFGRRMTPTNKADATLLNSV